jgi:hypothetical protein
LGDGSLDFSLAALLWAWASSIPGDIGVAVGDGGHDGSDLALSRLKVALVREPLSLLLQLLGLLSSVGSPLLLMLLLECISEDLLHGLTLALLFHVLELLAALLNDLLLVRVVFVRSTLTLLEVHAALVEPLSL